MKKRLFLFFGLWTIFAPALWSQARAARPTPLVIQITGQVRFPNGRAGPQGVQIILESERLGLVAQVNTDSSGKFAFQGIGQDSYILRARQPGFREAVERADIRTASTAYVILELKPLEKEPTGTLPPEGPGSTISAIPEDARKEFEAGNKLLVEKKDAKGSVPHLQKAVQLYAPYAPAYFLLGTAYLDQQKWKEAQSALEKAISINDHFAGPHLALGSSFAEQGKFADAEKPLLRGLELDPESARGHYELGRAYWALNRWPEAEPHAQKAAQLDPKMAPVHVLLGNIMLRKRDANAALREFKEYLQLDPQGPLASSTGEMVKKIEKALAAAK